MEITLNPDGFHRKLQIFCFGKNVPMFQSFCPYFWLTIFCGMFLFPLFPLIKILKYVGIGILWVLDKLTEKFDQWVCEPLLQRQAQEYNYNHDELLLAAWSSFDLEWSDYDFWRYQFFGNKKIHDRHEEARVKRFEAWKKQNPNWDDRQWK